MCWVIFRDFRGQCVVISIGFSVVVKSVGTWLPHAANRIWRSLTHDIVSAWSSFSQRQLSNVQQCQQHSAVFFWLIKWPFMQRHRAPSTPVTADMSLILSPYSADKVCWLVLQSTTTTFQLILVKELDIQWYCCLIWLQWSLDSASLHGEQLLLS